LLLFVSGFGRLPDMNTKQLRELDVQLTLFLKELVEPMGRGERRHWAQLYVQGLLLDGQRKSIEPMAAKLPGADVQALRQFVGQSPWEVSEVQRRLAGKLVDTLSEPEVWIIDETSFPKAGEHSVGVARQYCGSLGKIANCQIAVSLHWGNSEVTCPISWRLYLPEDWLQDKTRAAAVRLPTGLKYRSKTDLALELIDQAQQWKLPPMPVIADAAYGNSFEFREALRQRHRHYVMAVEASTVVWQTDPNLALPPPTGRGRPRQYPALSSLPKPQNLLAIARHLPASAWKQVTWRQGSQGAQRSRFALTPVWAAHGWRAQKHPPRVREWLLIEWPPQAAEPVNYWLGWMAEQTTGLRRWVRLAHARWRIEQDYRELKEELGLDHYEGRQWLGWHHHVTLVSMAFAFLRLLQARAKKNSWCDVADDSPATAGVVDSSHRSLPLV